MFRLKKCYKYALFVSLLLLTITPAFAYDAALGNNFLTPSAEPDSQNNYSYGPAVLSFYPKVDDYSDAAISIRQNNIPTIITLANNAKNVWIAGQYLISCAPNQGDTFSCPLEHTTTRFGLTMGFANTADDRYFNTISISPDHGAYYFYGLGSNSRSYTLGFNRLIDNSTTALSGGNLLPRVPVPSEITDLLEPGQNTGFVYNAAADLYLSTTTADPTRSNSFSVQVLYYLKSDGEVLYNIFRNGSEYINFYGLFDNLGENVVPEVPFEGNFMPGNACYGGLNNSIYPAVLSNSNVVNFFRNIENTMEQGAKYFNIYRSYKVDNDLYHYDYIFVPLSSNRFDYEFVYDSDDPSRITDLNVQFLDRLQNVKIIRFTSDDLVNPAVFDDDVDDVIISNIDNTVNNFSFDTYRNYDKMTDNTYSTFLVDKQSCIDSTKTGVYTMLLGFSPGYSPDLLDPNPDQFFNKIDVNLIQYYDVMRELNLLNLGTVVPPSALPDLEDGILDGVENPTTAHDFLLKVAADIKSAADSLHIYVEETAKIISNFNSLFVERRAAGTSFLSSFIALSALVFGFAFEFDIFVWFLVVFLSLRIMFLLLTKTSSVSSNFSNKSSSKSKPKTKSNSDKGGAVKK